MLIISNSESKYDNSIEQIKSNFSFDVSIMSMINLFNEHFDKWIGRIDKYTQCDRDMFNITNTNKKFAYCSATKKIYTYGDNNNQTYLFCLVNDNQCDDYNNLKCQTLCDPFGDITINVVKTNQSFQVFCKTLTGRYITIECNYDYKIYDMKTAIQDKEGIPPDQQRLIYNGKEMTNSEYMMCYGVQRESSCCLVLRLRGGMHHVSSSHDDYNSNSTRTSTNYSTSVGPLQSTDIQSNCTIKVKIAGGANPKYVDINIDVVNGFCTRNAFIAAIKYARDFDQ
jgi:ubiquitin